MVPGLKHIRTVNPCRRCVHLVDCITLLRSLSDALEWEHAHHAGYELPTIIVDCEGRYSPASRTRPVSVR